MNSEHALLFALTWVHCCLILHSIASTCEDLADEEDFMAWMEQAPEDDSELYPPVDSFVYAGEVREVQESEGNWKRRLVKRALFESLY